MPENEILANNVPPAASWTEPVLACFTEALELTDGDSEPGLYGVILHDIAYTHQLADDLPTALRYYRHAVEYKERGSSPGDLATTRIAFSDCLVRVGQYPKARVVLDQTMPGLELVPAEERAAYLHDAGQSYETLGRQGMQDAYTAALAAYQEARELLDPAADPGGYATVLRDMGDVQVALGRLAEAERSYTDATEQMRKRPDAKRSLASILDLPWPAPARTTWRVQWPARRLRWHVRARWRGRLDKRHQPPLGSSGLVFRAGAGCQP